MDLARPAPDGIRFDLGELVALRAHAAALARQVHRRSADLHSGGHQSPFRGRGMEYAESRPYAPGDDVRHIDWRVTARSGKTHTKLFQPERERISAVVIDRSAAMAFGTRVCFKSVQAGRLAALMTWHASRQGHRLAAACGGTEADLVAPAGGRRGALRVLDALVRWQPGIGAQQSAQAGIELACGVDALRRVLRPGSQVLVLLDARSVDDASASALARLRTHHDLAACLIEDPIECAPLPPGDYRIADGSRLGHLHLESGRARRRWNEHFSRLREGALEQLRRAGVRAASVSTESDPVAALASLLRGDTVAGAFGESAA